jgi:hypothetical protein
MAAAGRAIHVLPGDHDDWVVREEAGRELGHYPSRQAAEDVGRKLARKRGVEMSVCDRTGKVLSRSQARKSWVRRLFGRG